MDNQGIVNEFYAVARSNIVIPEYVVDEYGNYPTSQEEAERRFQDRREVVEPLIREKYILPNGFLYETKRVVLGAGFVLLAPIALPVSYMGELLGGSKEKKRSFGQVTGDYGASSLNPPTFERPVIRETIDNF